MISRPTGDEIELQELREHLRLHQLYPEWDPYIKEIQKAIVATAAGFGHQPIQLGPERHEAAHISVVLCLEDFVQRRLGWN
jgi:hypothetical protein